LFIFVHIPKTGGVTLATILTRQFAAQSLFNLDGTVEAVAAAINALPASRRDKLQCVYGHVGYGLHACFARPVSYITMLREPVDRVASAYYYARIRPEWGYHRPIIDGNLTLHDFAVNPISTDLHNEQTRMLGGTLEQARENLAKNFALVGIMEQFDESVLLAQSLFGWKNVFFQKENVNWQRERVSDLPQATIAAIEERNAQDIELYHFARRLFDEKLRQTPSIAANLDLFRIENRRYDYQQRIAQGAARRKR
jgi:hypothetical protein